VVPGSSVGLVVAAKGVSVGGCGAIGACRSPDAIGEYVAVVVETAVGEADD